MMKARLETYEAVAEPDGVIYNDLTVGNVYQVIGIEADWYRIMSDIGAPFLYPPELFTVVDAAEPADWVTTYGEKGEKYAYPKEFAMPGFFGAYFDYDKESIRRLRIYLHRLR